MTEEELYMDFVAAAQRKLLANVPFGGTSDDYGRWFATRCALSIQRDQETHNGSNTIAIVVIDSYASRLKKALVPTASFVITLGAELSFEYEETPASIEADGCFVSIENYSPFDEIAQVSLQEALIKRFGGISAPFSNREKRVNGTVRRHIRFTGRKR